eukprot:11373197-Alexandrium_andersonii.AAC.1
MDSPAERSRSLDRCFEGRRAAGGNEANNSGHDHASRFAKHVEAAPGRNSRSGEKLHGRCVVTALPSQLSIQ